MGSRGRKSSEELAVIGPGGIVTIRRPKPPASLNDEQASEWRKVVNGMPGDYFPTETHALLEARCRHVIWLRRLAQAADAEEKSGEFDLKRYRDLLRSAAEQSHTIAILDTKMRLSQQTTHDRRQRKPAALKKPWENS
jgi:hypothetical protein